MDREAPGSHHPCPGRAEGSCDGRNPCRSCLQLLGPPRVRAPCVHPPSPLLVDVDAPALAAMDLLLGRLVHDLDPLVADRAANSVRPIVSRLDDPHSTISTSSRPSSNATYASRRAPREICQRGNRWIPLHVMRAERSVRMYSCHSLIIPHARSAGSSWPCSLVGF